MVRVSVPLLLQLPADELGRAAHGGVKELLPPIFETPEEAPGSSAAQCGQLGSEPVDGRSLSLSLCLCSFFK